MLNLLALSNARLSGYPLPWWQPAHPELVEGPSFPPLPQGEGPGVRASPSPDLEAGRRIILSPSKDRPGPGVRAPSKRAGKRFFVGGVVLLWPAR